MKLLANLVAQKANRFPWWNQEALLRWVESDGFFAQEKPSTGLSIRPGGRSYFRVMFIRRRTGVVPRAAFVFRIPGAGRTRYFWQGLYSHNWSHRSPLFVRGKEITNFEEISELRSWSNQEKKEDTSDFTRYGSSQTILDAVAGQHITMAKFFVKEYKPEAANKKKITIFTTRDRGDITLWNMPIQMVSARLKFFPQIF